MDFEDQGEGGDELQTLKNNLLAGMRAYLADMLDGGGEAGYTGADVGECGRILDTFLANIALATHGDDESVLGPVQDAVRALNDLNARCNGRLIETDQSDQLSELITRAAAAAGVHAGEDITGAWREW